MKFIATPVKGMNDFLPADMRLRTHVLSLIRSTYATYGFDEIETPAMEHIENLTGKVVALPAREDIDFELQENMIVEYYSR